MAVPRAHARWRLHGDKALYPSGYADRALARWAERIELWQRGREPADARRIAPPNPLAALVPARDVYVYFDNDVKVYAPFDALALQRRLGQATFVPGAVHAPRRRPGRGVRDEPLRGSEAWLRGAVLRSRTPDQPVRVSAARTLARRRRR